MNRILYLLFLCCSVPDLAVAHDSNLATLQVIHVESDQWVFELKTPLYGLDQSLRKYLEDETAEPVSLIAGSREYKERLVEYIKAGFDVTTRGVDNVESGREVVSTRPSLGVGRLKLDDHMSILLFEIEDMPEVVEELEISFRYMSNNDAQHNIVRLIDGSRSQRYILNSSIGFAAVDSGFFLHGQADLISQPPVSSGQDLVLVK